MAGLHGDHELQREGHVVEGSAGIRAQNPRGEGQRLRQELLAAAKRLIEEGNSVEQISLRGIARETGIAAPSVYKHFRDKSELMWAVLDEVYAELADTMSAAARTASDPWAAVRAVVAAYWDFATHNRPRYQLMFHIGSMLPGTASLQEHPLMRVDRIWRDVVGAYLVGSGAAAGPVTMDQRAWLLWSGLHGQLGVWWGFTHEEPRQILRDLPDALLLTLFGRT